MRDIISSLTTYATVSDTGESEVSPPRGDAEWRFWPEGLGQQWRSGNVSVFVLTIMTTKNLAPLIQIKLSIPHWTQWAELSR